MKGSKNGNKQIFKLNWLDGFPASLKLVASWLWSRAFYHIQHKGWQVCNTSMCRYPRFIKSLFHPKYKFLWT